MAQPPANLDIAMGSGTTIVAAVQTGRNSIGIEKERKYFEIAERRAAGAQPPLFVETVTPANNGLHVTPQARFNLE
jgi:DNA modification methylase